MLQNRTLELISLYKLNRILEDSYMYNDHDNDNDYSNNNDYDTHTLNTYHNI